jgi:uncharacterized protein (TIGR00297 family)
VIGRAAAGLLLAIGIADAARRVGALSRGGAAAAVVCGTLAVAAGWAWGALLVAYFVGASALSRLRAAEKARRTGDIVAKGGARDAVQVLANGGIFAAAAALAVAWPSPLWLAAGAGSLAAAAADSWGTEIGTLARARPRMITTWRPAPPGTSGAVSAPGLAATVAGALFTAALLWGLTGGRRLAVAVAAGGVAGALADSLLGAVAQARRRCPACGAGTERAVHSCGAATVPAGGAAWLDNDAVNLLCGATGAAVALLLFARG